MASSILIQPDILGIPYGDRHRILDAARGKKDLVDLASGNPEVPLPPFIVKRLKESVDSAYMRYTNYYGLPELRQKIAERLKRDCGLSVDPETELLVTNGVQEGLYIVMRSILRSGDEVLIPSPHYANYYLNTVACGAKPVLVPLEEGAGFMPEIDRFEKAITSRTRAIVFCNPNNPLGVVWPTSILEGLANLAKTHNLIILVDEIYRDFVYTQRPVSIAALPGMAERTFTFAGFSKSYMMMGLRIGYVTGPAEPMFHIKKLHYCVALCPSNLGQAAALAALDCPPEEIDGVHQEFRQRLDMLYLGISQISGVLCVRPHGAFYAFPNMKWFGLNSMDLAIRLIETVGVMTLPGTEFGPYGEGYLRLSVCTRRDQLEKGIERLIQFGKEFSRR